jgi:micrococcal nuclease
MSAFLRAIPRRYRLVVVLALALVAALSQVQASTPVATAPTPTPSQPVTKQLAISVTPNPDATWYPVVKVVDGDTIVVSVDGTNQTVRLIGLDTPEVVDPRKVVQCFGKEASARAKNLLTDTQVRLEADPTQDERDKYGRILRYVFLADGSMYNLETIRQGYAHEYTYRIPYQYQQQFRLAEAEARQAERGLWSSQTCAGNTTQPAT